MSDKHKIHQGREDYLKALIKLGRHNEWVNNKDLTEALEVSAPSVSEMVRKLEQEQLVDVVSYRGVRLTDKGRDVAVNLIRAHRLWEVFLIQHLDYNWEEADKAAELLEHVSNIQMTERLAAFLNYPTHCPHGGAIPSAEGVFPEETEPKPLADKPLNTWFALKRVQENYELLHLLDERDIGLGSLFNILEKGSEYLLQVSDAKQHRVQELRLSVDFAHKLLVIPIED